ncbi:hypothetical protein HYC85_023591 [Camellia sinensis]|uniref:Uncharacterized protein n=1 Tax=Camellia sinensis TaxID=4442 RepID=A0A7J7GF04_CAMSI|nr:hypothetical protein HYC85_023591 [Camellia sinensis]
MVIGVSPDMNKMKGKNRVARSTESFDLPDPVGPIITTMSRCCQTSSITCTYTHNHPQQSPHRLRLKFGERNMLRSCCRCLGRRTGDGLLWHMDLKPHASGDFSIAVVQANSSLEDQSQVFTSPSATYIGVYDGHGGPEAS